MTSSSVQANAVNIVKGEIHNVLTVLRLNARWGTRARFSKEILLQAESPLIRNLKSLHSYLQAVSDLGSVNVVKYLHPFLSVIESPHTTGPMTGAALSSLHKFLLYGFMSPESPGAYEGIDMLARSITNFHFEESDPESDEVVLMKLLELSALSLRCEVGRLLTDPRCFEIFECCYRILNQDGVSSLLSNTAGNTLAHIVLIIFSRPRTINLLDEDSEHSNFDKVSSSSFRKLEILTLDDDDDDDDEKRSSDVKSENDQSDDIDPGMLRNLLVHKERKHGDALVEVMRFLSKLSNPRENSEDTCILSLSLINIALEAGGCNLSHHKKLVMQGDLCKHLLNSSQTDDLTILSLTLRVVFNLFNSIKDHLKIQLEVFITSIHLRILEGGQAGSTGHSSEQRELVLESLLEFCREPALMLNIYVNYDCDVQCSNLFETVLIALSRASIPSTKALQLNVLNRLAFDCVLSVVESMASRCIMSEKVDEVKLLDSIWNISQDSVSSVIEREHDTEERIARSPASVHGAEIEADADDSRSHIVNWDEINRVHSVLVQQKRMKKKLALAAQKFNSDPKGWIQYCQELGVLPNPATPTSVARFLKFTLGLDKIRLGEYLSKGPVEKYPFNAEVMREYAALFNYKNMTFDDALRKYLKEFRLPGEAQCIDRFMESFAREYYLQEKGNHPFADEDAVFILAFSIIMLNTDLHNPQIRDDKRMKKEDFLRNNRKTNGGEDFPAEFLESLYDSIAMNEIAVRHDLQDMVSGMVDYNLHWDGILNRSRSLKPASFTTATSRPLSRTAGVHERDMFSSIAEGVLQAFSTVFSKSQDDVLIVKALHGLHCYGQICTYFDMIDPFNSMLVSLFNCGIKYLSDLSVVEYNLPVPPLLLSRGLPDINDMEKVGSLATNATQHRGLMALKSAFEMCSAYGNFVSFAWKSFCDALLKLFDLHALPLSMTKLDCVRDDNGKAFEPSQFARRGPGIVAINRDILRSSQRSFRQQSGILRGLNDLIWGSSATLTSTDSMQSVNTYQDIAGALLEVATACNVEDIFLRTKNFPIESVKCLLHSFFSCRDPTSVALDKDAKSAHFFESHAVLFLELAGRVVLANDFRVDSLWPLMHSHLHNILSNNSAISRFPFLVERMIVTINICCIRMAGQSSNAAKILLNSLTLMARLPAEIIRPLSNRIVIGLNKLVQTNSHHMDDDEIWSVFTMLLGAAGAAKEGRSLAWKVVQYLVDEGPISEKNMRVIYQLIVWFLRGDFGTQGNDITYSPQAFQALGTFVLSLAGKEIENCIDRFVCDKLELHSPNHAPILTQAQADALWEAALRISVPYIPDENLQLSKAAISCVHRLLHQSFVKSHASWHTVFMDILLKLPLSQKEPKDQTEQMDEQDLSGEDRRLRCCSLVSRALLQNLQLLSTTNSFNTIWLTLIAMLGSNIKYAPPGSVVHETCQQIITNMVMVAVHSGIFQRWSVEGGKSRDLLGDTWTLLDPVCPSIRPLFERNDSSEHRGTI